MTGNNPHLVIIDEHEAAALAADDAHQRRQQMARIQHPNCRDPDHPGCDKCEPIEDDETERNEQ